MSCSGSGMVGCGQTSATWLSWMMPLPRLTRPNGSRERRSSAFIHKELFQGQSSKSEVISELRWTNLHGIAEVTKTNGFPLSRQKERVRALVELFTSLDDTAQVVKTR